MKHGVKFMSAALCAAMLISLISGCATKKTASNPLHTDENGNIVLKDSNGNPIVFNSEKKPTTPEEIKALYTPSAKKLAELANEHTVKPIEFSGFTGIIYETPLISEEAPNPVIMPVYSSAGLERYVEANSAYFDFGKGDKPFSQIAGDYPDDFFVDNCLLLISFNDADGGSGYSLSGGWEDSLTVDGDELCELVLAIKKSSGDNTSAHLIVEADKAFIGLWESYSVSLYE